MLGPLNIALEDYGVSTRNGFLPDELPLQLLPDSYYSEWEEIAQNLVTDLKERTIRSKVRRSPERISLALPGQQLTFLVYR
jgi:indoleamine 2,3-dioxygenase